MCSQDGGVLYLLLEDDSDQAYTMSSELISQSLCRTLN